MRYPVFVPACAYSLRLFLLIATLCFPLVLTAQGVEPAQADEPPEDSVVVFNVWAAPELLAPQADPDDETETGPSPAVDPSSLSPEDLALADSSLRKGLEERGKVFLKIPGFKVGPGEADLLLRALSEMAADSQSPEAGLPEDVGVSLTREDYEYLAESLFGLLFGIRDFKARNVTAGVLVELRLETLVFDSATGASKDRSEFTVKAVGEDRRTALVQSLQDAWRQTFKRLKDLSLLVPRVRIVEIFGADLILEDGVTQGVSTGDEFYLLGDKTESGARPRIGLVVVREARPLFSIARVVYSDRPPKPGDRLEEMEESEIVVTPRAGIFIGTNSNQDAFLGGEVAVRVAVREGLYSLLPVFEMGLIFDSTVSGEGAFLPWSVMVGGEYNLRLGRFKLQPSVLVGVVSRFSLAEGQDFGVSHFRALGELKFSLLLGERTEIFIDAYYHVGAPFEPGNGSFGNLGLGLGLSLK